MTTNKVKEVQEYLEKKGFLVTETTIVDMAIDLARRLGAGDWTFACEAEMRKEKDEEIAVLVKDIYLAKIQREEEEKRTR